MEGRGSRMLLEEAGGGGWNKLFVCWQMIEVEAAVTDWKQTN